MELLHRHLRDKIIILFILIAILIVTILFYKKRPQESFIISKNKVITIDFFYIDGCNYCESIKTNCLSEIKNKYSNHVIINEFNVDFTDGENEYNKIVDKLETIIKEKYYGEVPLIVIENYYALLGLDSTYYDDFINEIGLILSEKKIKSSKLDKFKINYLS